MRAFDADLGWTAEDLGTGKAFVCIECRQPRYKKAEDRIWSQVPQWSFLVKGIRVPKPFALNPLNVLPPGTFTGVVGMGGFLYTWDMASRRLLQIEVGAGIVRWLDSEASRPAGATTLWALAGDPDGSGLIHAFQTGVGNQISTSFDPDTGANVTADGGWSDTFIPRLLRASRERQCTAGTSIFWILAHVSCGAPLPAAVRW